MTYRRIKVLVETPERTIIGTVHKPEAGDSSIRLSDYLNDYAKQFLCLTDVEIKERGQQHRVGDKRGFIAIAIGSICYMAPLEDDTGGNPSFGG